MILFKLCKFSLKKIAILALFTIFGRFIYGSGGRNLNKNSYAVNFNIVCGVNVYLSLPVIKFYTFSILANC